MFNFASLKLDCCFLNKKSVLQKFPNTFNYSEEWKLAILEGNENAVAYTLTL